MEHTPRALRIKIHAMGVVMTASEANRLRVVTLLRVESESLCAQFNTAEIECFPMKGGKPPMSETPQSRIYGSRHGIQSIAS
jgi:hypothetical protein